MKSCKKIFYALILVISLCTAASAALPSVTMLSTKTCPACRQMSKVLDYIDENYSDKISTEHVYLEENPEFVQQYNVRYVPVLIFKDASGNEIAQKIGYMNFQNVMKVFSDSGVEI